LEVCCYHSKKYFYTPNDWRAEIEKLYKKGLISKKERNSYCNRMIANKTKVYIPERKKVEQIFKKRFKISSIYYPETPYYNPRNWPIYVLKKK
ncbi:hypothetical protein KKG58_00780, partial [Patescibacteria group bacterium]|nr:hypothetical protein [Patescibacteria group bacterium]